MTKFLPFIALLVFTSCSNSGTSTTPSADSGSVTKMDAGKMDAGKMDVSYPYAIAYSSKFELADPEKGKMILDLWKDFDNNTFDNSKDKFADTVFMQFPGMEIYASRDSMISSTKAYRNSYKAVKSKVDAVISTRSTDKNENWVLVWGSEVHTDKKNVTDSVYLHEICKLNKDGKVDYMAQFTRTPVKKK